MTIPLQTSLVYGPVNSRRFGQSLGINLLAVDCKICSFDCVYCQYGESPKKTPVFASLERMDKELGAVFSVAVEQNKRPDWIMIAGNGEPTLHPDFAAAVELINKHRDRVLPQVPIGILSNASTCFISETRQALLKLDGRFMKLDAGEAKLFKKINQPVNPDLWDKLIQGLHDLKSCVIQSLFVTGEVDNANESDVESWIRQICFIKPESVQIYTTQRPPKGLGILPVSQTALQTIAQKLTDKTGIACQVYF